MKPIIQKISLILSDALSLFLSLVLVIHILNFIRPGDADYVILSTFGVAKLSGLLLIIVFWYQEQYAKRRPIWEETRLICTTILIFSIFHLYESSKVPESATYIKKTHDAYTYVKDEDALLNSLATKCAVYIIRNPLDVVVSYAAHNGSDIDTAIKIMHDTTHCLSSKANGLSNQHRQKLLGWSEHVSSWINQTQVELLIIRYEDLQFDSFATVTKLAEFIGLPSDAANIGRAIENSSFSRLKSQEQESNFREKPSKMGSFFREGKVGGFKNVLTQDQIEYIIKMNKNIMKKFGYLDESIKLT